MSERLTERERRDYDALPAGAQTAYRNLRETSIDHGRAMEFARDVAIADELVDGAEAFAEKREGAEDDIVEAESKILDRLNVPLDESELGLTQKASDAVYAFAKLHTSKPEIAERVFGDPNPDKISIAVTRDEANSIAGSLDTLAGIDEGEHTDYDELIRLRDLILATPGVH